MARRNLHALAAQLRGDADQDALREALLVPWSRLHQAAEAYVQWHTLVLWVRAITEAAEDVPESVRSTLDLRCPGFLDSDWRALEEWIAAHRFAEAEAGGWLTALTYYAHKDLRTDQAWAHWERTTAEWTHHQPGRWPTLDAWAAGVDATHALSQAGTERARAVDAMSNANPNQLRNAVSDLLESRAFAIWLGCVSRPQSQLTEAAMGELRRRCPDLVTASRPAPKWDMAFLLRLVRSEDANWCATAREQGWISALRYQVRHHPRYQRLIHYRERCLDLWSQSRPSSYPPFMEWLAAADAYCVRPAE